MTYIARAILICVIICAISIYVYPADGNTTEIDAGIILPDYTIPDSYLEPKEIVMAGPIPEIEIVSNITYNNLHYNETTPENVQEFLDHIPPCPWFKDSAINVCSLNARYIRFEAKEHGLDIGECTVVDTDRSKVKRTMISGHRMNVFVHDDMIYLTTNLNKYHSDVVTTSELCRILNDLMGLKRFGTKNYKWV